MPDTIYKRFYSDYISDIFSIKRRLFKYKSRLPVSILNNLELNDRLIIGDTRYIINKITTDLVKGGDSLELINDIYDVPLPSDNLDVSSFRDSVQTTNKNAGSNTNIYYGDPTAALVKVDTGDGTGWITINTTIDESVETVSYSFTGNTTGMQRSMKIKASDKYSSPSFTVFQNGGIIRVDNNTITVDSNLITADNG